MNRFDDFFRNMTDEEWEKYKKHLKDKCGMDKLLAVYQGAYDRYSGGPDAG